MPLQDILQLNKTNDYKLSGSDLDIIQDHTITICPFTLCESNQGNCFNESNQLTKLKRERKGPRTYTRQPSYLRNYCSKSLIRAKSILHER